MTMTGRERFEAVFAGFATPPPGQAGDGGIDVERAHAVNVMGRDRASSMISRSESRWRCAALCLNWRA